MVLLDFELNFWGLYAENNVIYLKIFINKNNNKIFYLDDEAIQKYMSYGKDYISQLSSKICRSFLEMNIINISLIWKFQKKLIGNLI
jgi:hypothetical protein